MNISVDILKTHPDAQIPEYKSPGACAFDLAPVEDATIQPGEIVGLRTGLVIKVPEGYTLLIATRSSTPKKLGLSIPQAVGIVDNDFCGPTDELLLTLHNFRQEPVEVKKGQRLCQGLIVPIVRAEFQEKATHDAPDRGGWGSTG